MKSHVFHTEYSAMLGKFRERKDTSNKLQKKVILIHNIFMYAMIFFGIWTKSDCISTYKNILLYFNLHYFITLLNVFRLYIRHRRLSVIILQAAQRKRVYVYGGTFSKVQRKKNPITEWSLPEVLSETWILKSISRFCDID